MGGGLCVFIPSCHLNKGASFLRIMYYTGNGNSYSFPTFIKGFLGAGVASVVDREYCPDNVPFSKKDQMSSRFLRRFFFNFL